MSIISKCWAGTAVEDIDMNDGFNSACFTLNSSFCTAPPSGTPPTIDPNKPPSTVSTEPPVANCPNFNCVKFDLTIPELFTLGESLSYEVQVQPWTKEVQDNYRPFSG